MGFRHGDSTDSGTCEQYIDIARAELVPPGRPTPDSRLSILIWHHKGKRSIAFERWTIGRLRGTASNQNRARIAGWSQDPEYWVLRIAAGDPAARRWHLRFEHWSRRTPTTSLRAAAGRGGRVNAALATDDGYVRLLNAPICRHRGPPLAWSGRQRRELFHRYGGFNLQKKKQGEGRFDALRHNDEGLSRPSFKLSTNSFERRDRNC